MNILVVGLGLIGGSYAFKLTVAGHQVYGVDRDIDAIHYAKERNYIVAGSSHPEGYLSKADLVILAIYPNDVLSFIQNYAHLFVPNQVITDVTGIKGKLVQEIEMLLPEGVEFLGSHPMAGSEKIGIKHARKDMFEGANFLITPTEKTSQRAISMLEKLSAQLGFGKTTMITVPRHDEMVAFTSQLPHAIAVALINADDHADTQAFTGDSFRDLTRIAMINERLWSELLIGNQSAFIKELDRFVFELSALRKAVCSSDDHALQELFIKATKKRSAFDET